jgi:hypothetical protein
MWKFADDRTEGRNDMGKGTKLVLSVLLVAAMLAGCGLSKQGVLKEMDELFEYEASDYVIHTFAGEGVDIIPLGNEVMTFTNSRTELQDGVYFQMYDRTQQRNRDWIKGLGVKKDTTYVIVNGGGVVLQSTDYEEVKSFLLKEKKVS